MSRNGWRECWIERRLKDSLRISRKREGPRKKRRRKRQGRRRNRLERNTTSLPRNKILRSLNSKK